MVINGARMKCRRSVLWGLILLILVAVHFCGCAGAARPGTEKQVVTEYLLQQAGFQKWDVNDETPKRQALLSVLPPGTIYTYKRDGQIYHAYGDQKSNTIYVGDQAAYQKYLSMARSEQLCGRTEGINNEKFWSCFDESQQGSGGRPAR